MTTSHSRVALVTGASSGIGSSAASALVKAGFTVVGTSRNAARATAIPGVAFISLDVTDDASVAAGIEEVVERFGRIDVLVNNAGVGANGAAEESSIDQDKRVFDVNVFGVMRLTKAVLPIMRAQGSGRIVNLSSVLGFIPQPFMATYAASKWAIEGYTESVDHEVRQYGVRAVLVRPAYTDTSFDANNIIADTPVEAYAAQRKLYDEHTAESFSTADPASAVADSIVAAATDAQAKLHYNVGKRVAPISMMRRYVPASAFDAQIRKMNRLPR